MQTAAISIEAKRIRKNRVARAPQVSAAELERRDSEFEEAKKAKPIAMAVAKKIRCQFPTTPEGRLAFAVISKSIEDLFARSHRVSASRFLRGEMGWASLAGVDPDWIRLQLQRAGISIDPIFEVRHAD